MGSLSLSDPQDIVDGLALRWREAFVEPSAPMDAEKLAALTPFVTRISWPIHAPSVSTSKVSEILKRAASTCGVGVHEHIASLANHFMAEAAYL